MCGRLAIIELPQGEYGFYSWHGSISNLPVGSGLSKRFKVIAGKAVYLGNLHIPFRHEWTTGKTLLPDRDLTCNVKIADMRERDLPLVYQKNPKITADKVIIKVLQ